MHAPAVTRHSIPEYLAFAENAELRQEYYDGVIVSMSGGTVDHARLNPDLTYLRVGAREGSPCSAFDADARVRAEGSNSFM